MFTPREVQSFIRMLDVLSDPVKHKAILQELEVKAAHAEAKLLSMDEREDELSRREKRCAEIERNEIQARDEIQHKETNLTTREHVLRSREDQHKAAVMSHNEMARTLSERATFLTAREEQLNKRDAKLAEMELRMEAKAKELEAKLADVESQKAKLKEIVG